MNLEEIGIFLKSERTKRNLTIEDVARQLKINPRLLTALEAGNETALPHAAYVRGFIRSYGALLGVGREEIQSLLDGIPKVENISRPVAEDESLPEPTAPGGRAHSLAGFTGCIFLVVLILGILVGGGYWVWQNGYIDYARKSVEGLIASDTDKPVELDKKLPETGASLVEREEQREPVRRPEPERLPEPAVAPIITPEPIKTAPQVKEEPVVEPAKVEQTGEVGQPGQHKLIITATEECWVHSNADKTDTRQFSLRKGDTFALTFSKSLELKLGNAGGVRLRYDGNDLPAPGTSGQVKTIVFPPRDGSD